MPIFPTGVFSATNPTPSTSRASGTTGPAEQVAALNGEVEAIESFFHGGDRVFNVLNYGAVADAVYNNSTGAFSGTDNTAAFQATVDAIVAANTYTFAPGTTWCSGELVIPPGEYRINSPILRVPAGLKIRGAGRNLTILWYDGSGTTMFNTDTFTTTPSSIYQGTINGLTFEGFTVIVPNQTYYGAEGSRTNTFFQGNGNGGHRFTDIAVSGFHYGLAHPYNGNFDVFDNCWIENNDINVYLGPGAQQVQFRDGVLGGAQYNLVLEGSTQGSTYGLDFSDSSIADIYVLGGGGASPTMFGLSDSLVSAASEWAFVDSWFESGSSGATRVPPQHIYCVPGSGPSDSGTGPQHLRIVRGYLVQGGTTGSNNVFWRTVSGSRFYIDGLVVSGGSLVAIVDGLTSYPTFSLKNIRFVDGYTPVPLWKGSAYENIIHQNEIPGGGGGGSLFGYTVQNRNTPVIQIQGIGDEYPGLTVNQQGLVFNQGGSTNSPVTMEINASNMIECSGLFEIDKYLIIKGQAQVGNGTTPGPSLWGGTGVPSFAATVGDLYIRSDGTTGSILYRCTVGTGTWVGIL